MAKHSGPAVATAKCADTDATQVAHSVRRDFADLVAKFDRQLCSLSDSETLERSHIAHAKAAAERGLKLSQDLIAALSR